MLNLSLLDDDSASIHDKILSGSLKYCEEMSVWNSLSLSGLVYSFNLPKLINVLSFFNI